MWQRKAMVLGLLGFVLAGLAAPLLVGLYNKRAVLPTAAAFVAGLTEHEISSPIRLLDAPKLTLDRGRLAVSSVQQQKSGSRLAQILSTGSGMLTLEDAVFRLDLTTAPPAGGEAQAEASAIAPLVEVLTRLSLDSLAIRRGTLVILTAGGDPAELSNISADLSMRRKTIVTTTGTFNLRGQTLAFDTTMTTANWKGSGSKLPVKGNLRGNLIAASVLDGTLEFDRLPRLKSPLAEISSPNLRQAARWLGAAMPAGDGFETFLAKGALDWSGRSIAMEQSIFTMDGNTGSGALTLSWAGQRPSAEGTLAFTTLDLSRYAAATFGAGDPVAATGIDLSFVQHADADLRLSTDSVKIGPHAFGRSAAAISLVGGKLLADVAELDVGGARTVSGQFTADLKQPVPRYSLRGKIEQSDVGQPMALLLGHGLAQGNGTFAVDLASSGTTREQLMAHAAGKVVVRMLPGGRVAGDVAALAALAAGSKPETGWGAIGRGSTPLDTLEARFSVAGRQLGLEALKARAGATSVNGTGRIDLAAQTIDARFGVWRGEPTTSQPRPADSVPGVHVQGQLSAPALKPIARKTSLPAASEPAEPPLPPG